MNKKLMTTWVAKVGPEKSPLAGEEIHGIYVHLRVSIQAFREFDVSVDELHRIGEQLMNLAETLEATRQEDYGIPAADR